MKPTLIVVATFALCLAAVFVAPHHRRRENSFHACTLGEIYRDVLGSIEVWLSPRAGTFMSFVLTGMFASVYPALLVLMIARLRPYDAGGFFFVLSGLVALAGAAANFLGIIVSHLSLGFGVSTSTADQTPFFVILPIFQAAFAVAGIAIGASATCAAIASRWVTS
jgi:hypothetical protein